MGFTSAFVFSQVASLRQQLEQLQQGGRGGVGVGGRGGGGVRGGCGPEAPCGRSLAAMERAHRQALEELQRQHERQIKELETEKGRLLLEETQDTARGQQATQGRKVSQDQNDCVITQLVCVKYNVYWIICWVWVWGKGQIEFTFNFQYYRYMLLSSSVKLHCDQIM